MIAQLIAMLLAVSMHSVQIQVDMNATADLYAVETVECGVCGAHVAEWWYLAPYNPDGTIDIYGEPVEVCRYCYEQAL